MDDTDKLLAAGVIARRGNELVITEKGQRLLRSGLGTARFLASAPIGHQVAIDSKLARTKPHIKPKKKRR